jgi:uncharacterized protein YndB with AHSA1/START domain
MPKTKFIGEYELKASVKLIFNYLTVPSSLEDWFADKVKFIDNQTLDMYWDEVWHKTHIQNKRCTNNTCHVKYIFVDQGTDPNTLEFKVEHNEVTRTAFLRVFDYSEMEDEDAQMLWNSLIEQLKQRISA